MTAGDDNDDDAQLRQLRAVWVTMRDEDPPDRGLSALMSAAREKAAELEQAASPSWWQRVLATLRRPPVLALATVTLLLGGALIITQRSSEMKADAVVETEDKDQARFEAQVADDGYGDMAKGGEAQITGAAGSAAAVAPGVATPESATPAEVTAQVTTERLKNRDSKPASKAKPPTASTATSATKRPTDDALGEGAKESAPPRDPGTPAQAGPRGAGGGAPPVMSIAQDPTPATPDSATMDEESAKPKVKKPIARTAPPAIEGEDRQVSPTIEQLVKQCETAAARGDCAAVRVIAQKIQSTAPAAYKTKVASNAAINRCLPSTVPNAAAAE